MSKNLPIVLAFILTFLIFVSQTQAQDYEGIVPIDEVEEATTTPIATASYDERELRLSELEVNEESDFEAAKSAYSEALKIAATMPENAAINTKLDAILISARYHKLLNLYAQYFKHINTNFAEASPQIPNANAEMEDVEQTIILISGELDSYDGAIETFNETTDEELASFQPLLIAQSATIKALMEELNVSLLGLVSMVE